jgi:para-nitrobenzyl esterase
MPFIPVIDGDVLTARPIDAIAAGAGRGIELLAGTTAEEFRLFTVPTGLGAVITTAALPVLLGGRGIDPAVADVYTANRPRASSADIYAAIVTDLFFRRATADLADAIDAPAFVYEFAWRSPVQDMGACHALEIGFVFDNLDATHRIAGPNPPQRLADEMHSAWVAFAKSGDPGWPSYENSRAVMTFDDPESTVVSAPRPDELTAVRRQRETPSTAR